MVSYQKIIWHLTDRKTLGYIRKHPSLIFRYFRSLLSTVDYSDFVSNVLNVQKSCVQTFKPDKKSQKMLAKAFHDSIAPPTDHLPCGLEEAVSLYLMTRILKPKIVVETGVSAGRSSSYILCGLHDNKQGELYSIDPDVKSGYAISQKLKDRWHFTNATSQEVLNDLLSKTGKIDIFFHDSSHTYDNMLWEYETAWPYVRINGFLMSHDADWNSAFKDFSNHIKAKIIYLNSGFVVAKKL